MDTKIDYKTTGILQCHLQNYYIHILCVHGKYQKCLDNHLTVSREGASDDYNFTFKFPEFFSSVYLYYWKN